MTEYISRTNNQASGISNEDLDTECVQIEHDRHFLHIEKQATRKVQSCNVKDVVPEPLVEFWNIDTQFGRAGKYVNHPINLPTITLND